MANIIKHRFVSAIADSADATEVRPSNWNDEHVLAGTGDEGSVLVKTAAETDGASWTKTPTLTAVIFPMTIPGSPPNNGFWVETTGTTPTLYIRLMTRIAGVTYEILELGPV